MIWSNGEAVCLKVLWDSEKPGILLGNPSSPYIWELLPLHWSSSQRWNSCFPFPLARTTSVIPSTRHPECIQFPPCWLAFPTTMTEEDIKLGERGDCILLWELPSTAEHQIQGWPSVNPKHRDDGWMDGWMDGWRWARPEPEIRKSQN